MYCTSCVHVIVENYGSESGSLVGMGCEPVGLLRRRNRCNGAYVIGSKIPPVMKMSPTK
jgi:hypothetical protein